MTHLVPVSLLDWLISGLVSLLVLAVLLTLLRRVWQGKAKPPYQQTAFFSLDTATALELLDEAVGQELRVFAGVSLSELVTVNPKLSKSQRERAQLAMQGEHVDFVLCAHDDLSAKVVIMLIDDNQSKKDHRKHQQLLQNIEEAGLSVITLSANAWPSIQELHSEIMSACEHSTPASQSPTISQGRIEPTLSLPEQDQTPDQEPEIKL